MARSRPTVLVALLGAALLAGACGGSPRQPTTTAASGDPSLSPVALSPSPSVSPSPSPSRSGPVDPSPDPVDPASAGDPAGLPGPPGAVETGRIVELDDGWRELTVTYRTPASLDDVLVHYRRALRTADWRVTDVDVDSASDAWEIEAVDGPREVEIELVGDGTETLITVSVSTPAT